MANRTWTFDVNGKPHEVLLRFGVITGRQIWLDGTLIDKGRALIETSSDYHFSVENHPAELGIISKPAGYEYYLRIDDEFVFPKNDKRKKISESIFKYLEQRRKWIAAGKKYGLEYYSQPGRQTAIQYRLIGYVQNYLVLITSGSWNGGGTSIPGNIMIIRHANIDADKAREIKNSKEIKQALRAINGYPELIDIQPNFSTIFLRSGLRKVDEAGVLGGLVSAVPVLSGSLHPTFADKCEGTECKSPYNKDLTLVLINLVPAAMCQECIDRAGDIGKKTEAEYKKHPGNLGKGILYGLAAAFLGAIAWALGIIFFDMISAVFAILILLLVVKAMDYAKTKRTLGSMLIAGMFSLAGAIVGSFFGLAGYLFKEGKFEPTINEFIKLARYYFMAQPKLLNETILYSLIGLVPYLFFGWNAQRKYLKQAFKPKIEVIKNFELRK
jgi:hypothetical protein